METLRRPLALVLGLMSVVVLFHFLFNPFYEDTLDSGSIWQVLNWVMAVGIIITLALTYARKREGGADDDTNTYICVNVAFYAAAVLAILFFWNWFDSLTAGEDGQSPTRGYYWVIVNTLFIVLLGTVSAHLWKDSGQDTTE